MPVFSCKGLQGRFRAFCAMVRPSLVDPGSNRQWLRQHIEVKGNACRR